MANIAVNQFTFKPIVDMDTIIVSVFADGKLIKDLEFSLSGYTTDTAVAAAKNTAENFGILGPGNVDLYEKVATPAAPDGTPAAAPTYVYEIKKIAFRTYIVVYEVGSGGEKEIYKGPEVANTPAQTLVDTAILDIQGQYPGAKDMTLKPSATPAKYKYEIKKYGPQKYIVVYEVGSTGEKQIFEGNKLIGAPDETLVNTAILGLEGKYPGVKDMTPKTPPAPTVPKTEPPVEPPPSPLPKNLQTNDPPKYIPPSAYKKAKNTPGGEFIVKETGAEYKGPYIETAKKQYLAGETPEQNGVELEKLERSAGIPDFGGLDFLSLGLSLFAVLQSAYKKQLSQDEIDKGLAKRYFVQDNRTNKISETSQEAFEQAKTDLPNFKSAEVDWNIRTPAQDVVINGIKFQGSESRNKEAIKNLESQLPGISNYVTDYTYLVPEVPLPESVLPVETETISKPDPTTALENSRKASFDLRK
jgi:hypothetical protein